MSAAALAGASASRPRPHLPSLLALALAAAGLFGALSQAGAEAVLGSVGLGLAGLLALATVAASFGGAWGLALVAPASLTAAFLTVAAQRGMATGGGWGYWAVLAGTLLAAAFATGKLTLLPQATSDARGGLALAALQRILPAATVPLVLLLAWEGLVVGFRVPTGIFPRVSDIGSALRRSWPVLMADAYLTFVREVLFGFAVGLASGFLAGSAIAFSGFLRRGFLPLATAFGAVPIVGLAPVLGRALGVDWESKAAVVVIVTFFPVVLNTVQGLTSVDPLRLELLRSYAATPLQIFFSLRLPNALPYLFNALKISVVVAVIGVIVAEFLIPGPPSGLGQRISLSAHRGAFDIVFAAILVSSVISMALYWAISLLERLVTGWHPSARSG